MTAPAVPREPDVAAAAPLWMRSAFSVLVVLLIGAPLAVGAWQWMHPGTPPVPPSLQGQTLDLPAKDFALQDLNGHPVRLADYRGKTVFLNFWASWCPPCVQELPSIVSLSSAMRGRPFVVFAVSEDDAPDDVRKFFGDKLPDFPVVWDDGQKVTEAWGTFKFPETYVIDPEGRVRAKFIGGREWDSPESIAWFDRLTR